MTEAELNQKAEEWVNKEYDNSYYPDCNYSARRDAEQAYIAGATENGIQWHDLRKGPNDLAKGQINRFLFAYVKNYGGKKPMIICYNGEWFYDANTYNDEVKVIAWCEIPQFKE